MSLKIERKKKGTLLKKENAEVVKETDIERGKKLAVPCKRPPTSRHKH